jgi:hypothetical protein
MYVGQWLAALAVFASLTGAATANASARAEPENGA